MTKILLASHGKLAEGMKNSVEIIMGEASKIEVINAYVDDTDFENDALEFLKNLKNAEKLIVVTDLLGGSVNNTFIEFLKKYDFYLVSGMNLLLVIQLLLLKGDDKLEKELKRIIAESKDGVILCNDLLSNIEKVEDDF